MANTDPALDRLALGSTCPTCDAGPDEPCTTPTGVPHLPHLTRIDRAVKQFQTRQARQS